MRTKAEQELGNSYEEVRNSLEAKCIWDEANKVYWTADRKHKFTVDGDELLDADLDMTFADVAKYVQPLNNAANYTGMGVNS